MFAVDCPMHEGPVLLSPSNIVELRNTPHGIEMVYECVCGHEGVWLPGLRRAA